ncbi:MAG TPA: hypothetical protein VG844_10915 [Terracidiphilus sp.]|nr:hypothetical protein [Terracidiphilus sp.]
MWMSWKHRKSDFPNPLTFEQKVEVFYEQTLGWQLHIADLVANGGKTFGEVNPVQVDYEVRNIRHSGFAVLHICLSYFELIGTLVSSTATRPSDTDKFKAGVKAVLPSLFKGTSDDDALLKVLYKGARCGLYHLGRPRAHVGLGQPQNGSPIEFDSKSGTVIISPERLPVVLKKHLDTFKADLLNPANTALRNEFQKRFDKGFE